MEELNVAITNLLDVYEEALRAKETLEREKQAELARQWETVEEVPEGEKLTWNVTPEQIARINAGDRSALDEFYTDLQNLTRIKYLALKFLRHNRYLISVISYEDLIQQAYFDLRVGLAKLRPYDAAIGKTFFNSFQFAAVGGIDEIFIPFAQGRKKRCQKETN